MTVETFEPEGAGTEFPILIHVFQGRTREEAWGYVASHRKTDRFFAGCFAGRFGEIACVNRTTEGWA